MNIQVKPRVSKRVADYFVIVSAEDELAPWDFQQDIRHSVDGYLDIVYHAFVSNRYPLVDLPDVPLTGNLEYFCLPNGLRVAENPVRPSFHSFVLTLANGDHQLGCCLTFYEPISRRQRESMIELIKAIAPPLPEPPASSTKNKVPPTTSHPVNAEEVFKTKKLYLPRCLCLISRFPFVSSFKTFLCGLYRLSLAPMQIPIERYISNFLEEVPAPPAGRVDITYYLGELEIRFRCPPANEPHAWSGLSLFPLFECLSPEKLLEVFALVLTERQLLFISSQYSLLTCSIEAITSLIYPLTWCNSYVPVLPRQLLRALEAPFPFILGIHSSFLQGSDCLIGNETVRIYLDENRIDFGSKGPAPPLPDRPYSKLLQVIKESAPLFERRAQNWAATRLVLFDDAFSTLTDHSTTYLQAPQRGRGAGAAPAASLPRGSEGSRSEKNWLDEEKVRAGFLNFFVGIFKSYRKFLIYGTPEDPDPMVKFRFEDFLAEHPTDWQPILNEITLGTQSFSHFVDERIFQINRDMNVLFFDETIDAKMNRYTFRLRNIDTPFILDSTTRHTKTYVPPTPDTTNLPATNTPSGHFEYDKFPQLDPNLFSAPRQMSVSLDAGQTMANANQARLKRIQPQAQPTPPLSAVACVYSCYIVSISHVICSAHVRSTPAKKAGRSTSQIIGEFAPPTAARRNSLDSVSQNGGSPGAASTTTESPRLILELLSPTMSTSSAGSTPDSLGAHTISASSLAFNGSGRRSIIDECGEKIEGEGEGVYDDAFVDGDEAHEERQRQGSGSIDGEERKSSGSTNVVLHALYQAAVIDGKVDLPTCPHDAEGAALLVNGAHLVGGGGSGGSTKRLSPIIFVNSSSYKKPSPLPSSPPFIDTTTLQSSFISESFESISLTTSAAVSVSRASKTNVSMRSSGSGTRGRSESSVGRESDEVAIVAAKLGLKVSKTETN